MLRGMRLFALAGLLVLTACVPPQTLTSPCVGQPDGGSCPACSTDADCSIVTNLCHETAACVPTAGHWAATQEGCAVEHPPTQTPCVCHGSVCQAAPTR